MKVEQFLYLEARLLDTQQYEAWLELFTEDATYWVPLEHGQKDPFETSSIIHDDRTLLGLRVKQARHPRAHARLPLARTAHHVSNILVLKEDEPELLVASTLTLVEFRAERQRVWGALVEQYEQRAWVPHADDIIRRFGEASDEVRARLGQPGTYAYGPGAAETLDVYGFSTRKALVFVHGGAWKRQSKRENAFAAETFIHAGAAYVALDFALLPTVTLPEMVG